MQKVASLKNPYSYAPLCGFSTVAYDDPKRLVRCGSLCLSPALGIRRCGSFNLPRVLRVDMQLNATEFEPYFRYGHGMVFYNMVDDEPWSPDSFAVSTSKWRETPAYYNTPLPFITYKEDKIVSAVKDLFGSNVYSQNVSDAYNTGVSCCFTSPSIAGWDFRARRYNVIKDIEGISGTQELVGPIEALNGTAEWDAGFLDASISYDLCFDGIGGIGGIGGIVGLNSISLSITLGIRVHAYGVHKIPQYYTAYPPLPSGPLPPGSYASTGKPFYSFSPIDSVIASYYYKLPNIESSPTAINFPYTLNLQSAYYGPEGYDYQKHNPFFGALPETVTIASAA